MKTRPRFFFPLLFLVGLSLPLKAAEPPANIVFVLCDDLGYGDVKCLNPEGKIETPHMDAIARRGMKFTDAHSSSAVCTPTRYSLMTGRYHWRSRLQSGVLGGLSPRLIEPGRETVASLLRSKGYRTACIGKWHLGMDWVKLPGQEITELGIEKPEQVHNVDYTQPIANGPRSVGFDEYFGISASLDMVPYVFIEDDRVTAAPTETMKLEMNAAGGRKSFTREGPGAPGFRGEDVLPTLTRKAVEFIGRQAGPAKEGRPFFLYVPLASPHTPILPTDSWRGKSGISLYADFVMETDDAIGQIVKALQTHGIAENTLVIVTSDNGCSPTADYPKLAEHGHDPSRPFRGHKADLYEGGHRVPYVLQWPAVVKAGGQYDHPVGLWDLLATAAEIAGVEVPETAGEDSVSLLPVLRGGTDRPVRDRLIHQSINGSLSLREGKWKLLACPDSGGWSEPRPRATRKKGEPVPATEQPLAPVQLYDLGTDIGESVNVADQHPEIVSRLAGLLEKDVRQGRSTPGAPQKNTVEPKVWKYSPRPQ